MATDFALATNVQQFAEPASSGESVTRRILLVDDTAGAAQMMARLLGTMGHQVAIAHDGQTAIDTALHTLPHMIVLDLNLPDMSGCEVAQSLRQHDELSDTLFVALTGYSDAETRAAASSAGFDEFVVKPAPFETLEQLLLHPKLSIGSGI